MKGATTGGAGTAYPSGASEFTVITSKFNLAYRYVIYLSQLTTDVVSFIVVTIHPSVLFRGFLPDV
jgi:hypothetical protein